MIGLIPRAPCGECGRTKTSKTRPFLKQLDVYYLGVDRKQAQFNQGIGRDQRHTRGFNLHAESGAFASLLEADYQFGRFGQGAIRAWKYAQSVSYSFPQTRLRPVAALLGAISSGDKNAADRDLQTFHPLFPKALYYGYIDGSGSLNAIVVHPRVTLQLSETIAVTVSNLSFWRQRTTDGLYSQPGFLLRTGDVNQRRYVGTLQDLSAAWRVDAHVTVDCILTKYEVGSFLRHTQPPGKDLAYFSIKASYKF
jgi:Alginate export